MWSYVKLVGFSKVHDEVQSSDTALAVLGHDLVVISVVEIFHDFGSGEGVDRCGDFGIAEEPTLEVEVVRKFFTDEEASVVFASPGVFLVEFTAGP